MRDRSSNAWFLSSSTIRTLFLTWLADKTAPFEGLIYAEGKRAARHATDCVETTPGDDAGAESDNENEQLKLQQTSIEIAG
jgi:hypothetical protein